MVAAEIDSTMTLCLVSDDPVIETAVRATCTAGEQVEIFSRREIVNGHRTLSAHGEAILQAAEAADAVLIDWDFDQAPSINTLCYHLRSRHLTPVFTLCRVAGSEQVACVAAGADDALTLPLHLPYLKAKVMSYRRLVSTVRAADGFPMLRTEPPGGGALPHDVRAFGYLKLDLTAHRFYVRGAEVELTPREFALVDFLMERAETLCTRTQILDHVWGIQFETGTNMVDVYMYFLRKKLESYGLKDMIETVRGLGYRLVRPAEGT